MAFPDDLIAGIEIDRSKSHWRTELKKPRPATFDAARSVFARMVTSKGPLLIKLMPETAPAHVTSFAYLARLGFFDGLSFHRVIPGFMAQGGCPRGDGTGGPGYRMDGEHHPRVRHDRAGMLSSANAGPGTDGSQFFLTFVPTPWLDGKHTVFGAVEEGADVLERLEAAGTPAGRPKEPVGIEAVTIEVR
jgi:cyclophilin family peptidyl-prolyl cis-trans isomerase